MQLKIVITEREWRAVCTAWAMYEAQDSDLVRVEDLRALNRLKKKWFAALDDKEANV